MANQRPKKKSHHPKNNFAKPAKNTKKPTDGVIKYTDSLSVLELADLIGCQSSEIIKFLFMLGKMVTINTTLDDESIELIALEHGLEVVKEKVIDETNFEEMEIVDDPEDLVERPPVVTIMGHVDHGKTSLLDAIRKTRVVEGEFGGITQHIGAYQVGVNGKKITFLDTPGHEAFTAMRARGASVTDVAIIVVAADDGVMPQTREAVDHAKAAKVPIIVAVNKMDKEGADPDKVMRELSDLDLLPEEWGGSTIYVRVSAKTGQGIKDLLETLLVVAEVQELKANPNRLAIGTVIEAKLDKGRGPVATVLVQTGTLHSGDPIVCGTSFGAVRKMVNDMNKEVKTALPSTPVEIIGLSDVPTAGDRFVAFSSAQQARAVGETRLKLKQESDRRQTSAMSLDDLARQIQDKNIQEITVIVKADVQGTAEAVSGALSRIEVEGVRVNVIRAQAGAISESDVSLASASNAIIYGFNVRPDAIVRKKAEEEKVDIRLHNIIYKMTEELEAAMKGMLAPDLKEVVTGQCEVRQVFKVSKIGTIAGCFVTDGSIKRDCGVRLIRNGIVIYEGKLGSLKRFSNDAKEVNQGYECGVTIENYNDIKEGDIIEGYVIEEVARY